MPTTRSANAPAPKRALTPDSDDGEEDDFVKKPSGRGRGRGRGRGSRGGRGRGGEAAVTDGDSSSGEGNSSLTGRGRGRGRGGRGGRGRGAKTADGQPPVKKGRKKRAARSDSEDEGNVESDHLHDELKKCLKLMKEFEKSSHSGYTFAFRTPVDTVLLGLADYHEIIKKPMDMSTMKKKLIGEEYDTASEFKEDFKLMINNCLTYNNEGDPVAEMAIQFRDAFAAKWKNEFPEDHDDFGKSKEEDESDEGEESDGGEKAESPEKEQVKEAEKPREAQATKSEDNDDNEDEREEEEEDSSDEEDGLDDDRDKATSSTTAAVTTTASFGAASNEPKPVEKDEASSSEALAVSSSEAQAASSDVTTSEAQPKGVDETSAQLTTSHAADSTTEADSTA